MNAKTLKRGFTIVELVVVIAVIAILAAVIIPTAVNLISNAQVSADTQLVKNLNTVLSSAANIDGEKNATAHDAFLDAEDAGYNVEKLTPTSTKHDILWDSSLDRFVLLDENAKEVFPKDGNTSKNKADLFKVYAGEVSSANDGYSVYLAENATCAGQFTFNAGFDAGNNTNITNIAYINNSDVAQTVTIRTNGGELAVSAPLDTVNHYGEASVVDIAAIAGNSFHEFGKVNLVKIESGRFVAEADAEVKYVAPKGSAKTEDNSAIKFQKVTNSAQVEKLEAVASLFANGLGTKDNPYIIANAADIQKISELYDLDYNYFKVADGVSIIDCANWTPVNLNGSFDGNGVTINNLTNCLFLKAGYQNEKDNVVISNLTANLDIVHEKNAGLVRNVFTSGSITFENVSLHGYIESSYNVGSFYQYGPANYDGIGASYSAYFVNAKSDVTMVCTTGNVMGGMLGHAYQGEGNTFKMYVDANSGYAGTMYGANGNTTKYFAASSDYNCFYVNDVKYTGADNNKYTNVKPLNTINPVKSENGYTVEKAANATTIKVSINAQMSKHDATGTRIPNESGLTWVMKTWSIDVSDISTANLLNLVDSAVIINGTNNKLDAVVEDGVLKVYTGSSSNFADGTFTLIVTQYDENGNVQANGRITLATIPYVEPAN